MNAAPPRASLDQHCTVCGGVGWADRQILWPGLIEEWELTPGEVAYIDRQQGTTCVHCGANLRSMALADAIKTHIGASGPLADALAGRPDLKILEINEAGNLSPTLRTHPGYTFGAYPELDMQAMPYEAGTFDLVVHSDTLEHVPDPIQGLRDCRRVLKSGGACAYTVPIVVDRLSRRRDNMPASYHGRSDDLVYLVVTEYGADAWKHCMQAGFRDVRLNAVDYPSAVAITAVR